MKGKRLFSGGMDSFSKKVTNEIFLDKAKKESQKKKG